MRSMPTVTPSCCMPADALLGLLNSRECSISRERTFANRFANSDRFASAGPVRTGCDCEGCKRRAVRNCKHYGYKSQAFFSAFAESFLRSFLSQFLNKFLGTPRNPERPLSKFRAIASNC